ncbi:hypothetical protein [Paenibacillus sp. NRS-1781]|uniref:hypothetical protein n=1 Tax=Paenibacillus sp. NRS-1781 TaxID=3233905 RepID=UPI003D2C8028
MYHGSAYDIPPNPSARGRSSARHATEREGFACCAHMPTLRTYAGGSRLRILSLARSWKDCGLFAAQIRQSFQERCFAIEKQWNTAFLSQEVQHLMCRTFP